jgi:hypothetical protein
LIYYISNMKKFHILVIAIFGFLLMPSIIFACGNNSEKHSCKKETSSKMDKDDCCKDDSHSKTKNHDNCGGKCRHSKCGCVSSSNSFTSSNEININNKIFNFSYEKQNFCNSEAFISSGFYFLWLIPKIS